MPRASFNLNDRFTGYRLGSVVSHWLGAFLVVALYVNYGADAAPAHVGLGLVATPFLLARVRSRFARGFPRIGDHSTAVNFATRLVMVLLLLCIVALVVTGLLLPALKAETYDVFGWFSFSLPLPSMPSAAAFMEAVHATAGHACILLAVVHVLETLAQQFYDRSAVLTRMLKPVRGGK